MSEQNVVRIDPQEITPMSMLDRAVQSGASIETLTKLMELQERFDKNQARKAFDDAMAGAKSEICPVFKNKTVSHGVGKAQYRHEDMAEIARTVAKPLADHGLSYRFRTSSDNSIVSVTCIVSHRLGHSEENTLVSAPDAGQARNAIQAIGSAISYLQRYTLKAALGLAASDDDDGRATSNGNHATIDAEQLETLRAKLELTKAGEAGFLQWAKLEKLEETLAKDYDYYTAQTERAAR